MNIEDAASGHALRSLRLLLEAYATGELPQWDLFASNVRSLYVPAGSVVYTAGENHRYIYFIQRGFLKAQMADPGGRPTTVFFSEEGDILASVSALGSEGVRKVAARGLHPRSAALQAAVSKESTMTVIAIDNSLVQRVNYRVIEHLSSQFIQWSKLTANIALMHAATLQADAAWLRGSAEQRYRQLLELNPALVQRVTQRDLASFLNVTEASLSRIVKRIKSGVLAEQPMDEELEGEGCAHPATGQAPHRTLIPGAATLVP